MLSRRRSGLVLDLNHQVLRESGGMSLAELTRNAFQSGVTARKVRNSCNLLLTHESRSTICDSGSLCASCTSPRTSRTTRLIALRQKSAVNRSYFSPLSSNKLTFPSRLSSGIVPGLSRGSNFTSIPEDSHTGWTAVASDLSHGFLTGSSVGQPAESCNAGYAM